MDPFKFIQVSTNEKIKNKIPDNMNLFQILNSIHGCYCLELIGLEEELIIDYFEQEYTLLYENASALENKVLVLHHSVPFDSDTDIFHMNYVFIQ